MEIPIELFLGGIGVSIALGLFGFLRQPQIPAMLVFGGMFILIFAVATTGIIINSFGGSNEIRLYDVLANTANVNVETNNEIRAIYPSSSSSQLIGYTFDCIEIPLAKAGVLTGGTFVNVGVFGASGNTIKLFGDPLDVDNITTGFFFYEFCLPEGETYTIGSLAVGIERIGVQYDQGDATNRVLARVDGNNPFDSTNTFLQTWNGASWASSTGLDLSASLVLSSEPFTNNVYEFTELPKTLFGLIGAIFMLCGALMVARND